MHDLCRIRNILLKKWQIPWLVFDWTILTLCLEVVMFQSAQATVKNFGLSFVFIVPKIWIDFPNDLCSAASIAFFRNRLKI